MTRPVYSQMNTLVRVKEARMLTRAQKLSLIHAADFTAALKQLGEAGFFAFSHIPSASDYHTALASEKRGWIAWAKELSPDKALADFFMLKDTVSCLKGMLAERLTSKPYQPCEDLTLAYSSDELRLLAQDNPKAKELFENDWITALHEAAVEYENGAGLFGAEYRLDRFYIEQLLKTAAQLDEPGIYVYTSAYADIYHLSVLLQSRQLDIKVPRYALVHDASWKGELSELFNLNAQEQDSLIRAGRYASLWDEQSSGESLALFDARAENFLLGLCMTAKLEAFGIFPLFGFMVGKLMELADVRLILSGKSWKLPSGEIEKRMRECYEL